MAKQSFVTGQVLTAQQVNDLQTNDFNQTVSAKTASYTLVAADKGTRITMSSTSATTITVNTGLFAAGDTLFIQNLNTGVCTITAGTATVDTSASLALAQHEGGTLYFTSAGVSTFFKAAGAAAASGGMTLLSTTTLSGASTTISGISGSYTDLQIVGVGIDTSANADLEVRLNGNTGSNYVHQYFRAANSTLTAADASGTSMLFGTAGSAASYADATNFVINIPRYSETEFHPIYSVCRSYASGYLFYHMAGAFNSTAAISSITIFTSGGQTYDAGTVYVYGVK